MSVMIINSLFILVIIASFLMACGLVWLSIKITQDEERKAKELEEAERFRDIFEKTNLRD